MQIRLGVMKDEMTLKQVREDEPGVYVQDLEKLQKLQQDYRLHQAAPRHRVNYFIGGMEGDERKGRTGKTQLTKLFAKAACCSGSRSAPTSAWRRLSIRSPEKLPPR